MAATRDAIVTSLSCGITEGVCVKAAESGRVCVKREVDGVKIIVVRKCIVKECASERRGRIELLNGRYRSKPRFFQLISPFRG